MKSDVSTHIGVPILGIIPNSPAARGGAKIGDRIISVDGFPITSATDYIEATNRRGTTFHMEVMRGNKLLSLVVDNSAPAVSEGDLSNPEAVMGMFDTNLPTPTN